MMTFKRVKGGSRPLHNYDIVPKTNGEDSIDNAPEHEPAIGEQAVRAVMQQYGPMTPETLGSVNLIPRELTESEWGPGNARKIDQTHGPSL